MWFERDFVVEYLIWGNCFFERFFLKYFNVFIFIEYGSLEVLRLEGCSNNMVFLRIEDCVYKISLFLSNLVFVCEDIYNGEIFLFIGLLFVF